MKRKLIWIAGIMLLLITAYIGYGIWFDNAFFSPLKLNIKEYRVLVDSLKLNDISNLYLFKYESYIGGPDVKYIGIESRICQCNKNNAFVKGDFILGIRKVSNDSIFIESLYGFTILRPSRKFHFIYIQDSTNRNEIKHIQGDIPFRNLCK